MPRKGGQPTRAERDTYDTAHHEAGHAVAALHYGIGPVFASIVPDPADGTLGHVRQRQLAANLRPDLDDPATVRRHLEPRIRSLYAGVIAERRYRGGRRHNWTGAASDLDRAAEYVTRCVGSPDAAKHYSAWLWVETASLVERSWPSIEAVADALLDKGTLQRREIVETVRSTHARASVAP